MDIKLLPYTSRATLDIGDASPLTITPVDRAQKPYPPGNVKVNGNAWPNGAHIGAVDATLTWAHRNKKAQDGWAVVAQDAASVAAGPEGSYTVEVLIDGEVISGLTTAGITGTSFVYTLAQRTEDNEDMNKPVQFRITPVNNALTGMVRTTDPFVMQA